MMARARELWSYRQLLRSLMVRNLKVKYQRSVLGFVWALLNPVLIVAVLAVVFTHIVRIPLPHYLAFLLSGYFVWNFLLQAMSASTYVLAEHASLTRSVAFPREVPVLAAVGSRLVEFGIEMGLVLFALVTLHHHGVPASFLWLPWLVLVQVVLALGLVFPLAALAAFYQDVQHALPIALTTLFYVSPVFYPASMVPAALRSAYLANPLAQLMTAYHQVVYAGQAPSGASVSVLTVTTALVFGVGYAIFNRYRANIAEII